MNASFRLSALALALASVSSQASEPASGQLPSGGQVQAGQANISQSGHQLTVTQSSDRAVIDWQSFDVGSDAQVHFDQPSVSSATLNRVLSSNPTQVMGRITAPGQVFLVNPNGVLFGPNSQVDVGGLAASTLDIDNADFMAGDLRFHSGAGSGSITSQGEIETTLGGFVAFLAPEVINEGLIVAPYGRVAMAAGERIEIDLDGQGRWVQVEPALVDTLIENRHAIEVNAGQILLSSRAANELARGVIRQSGTLTANSMVQSGGRILLEGDDIGLSSSAQIQANGALGGGDVLIGGDWQGGQNAERRVFDDPTALHQADTVQMEAGASIQANATDSGDGGTVVLWSDIRKSGGSTRAYGEIQAQGGPNGGDGGQVETSGAYLDVAGIAVSTLATAGASGVWLLDPANITLGDGATGAIPGSEGPSSDTNLTFGTIHAALQSGNVEIYTGDAGSGTASITMASGTKWNFEDSSGHSLTLRAHNTVNISGELTNSGGIHLIGDNIVIGTSGQNADVIVNHAGSDLTLTAADYIMTNDSIRLQTQGGDIVLWSDSDNSGQGHIQLGTTNTFSSGGGDIILAGGEDTNSDSRPDGYAVTSGANSKPGVRLGADGSRVELRSYGGDITIRGEHNSTSATGQGVTLTRNITIDAGAGAIEIEGRSNNGIGIDFGTAAPTSTYSIVSAKASGTAIRIVGAQTATSSTSNLAIRSAMSGSFSPNIAATGGGDVIIQGTNSTSAATDALALGNMQIQASAGNISIDGGTQGISFGAGSRAGAGTLVSSSTADVTIRADRLSLKSLSVTAGDLSLVSSSDSFTSLTLPTAAMQVSDYTIGSTTNTLALTLQNSIGSGSSVIGGDISIYAGDLTIKDGLTIAARPGFDVLVSSSGNFTNLAGSTAINTSNGGRWLVFAADAADNTYGSLDSGNQAIWGEDVSTFDASAVSGNRYVFGALTGQTVAALTVTSADASKVYGTVADLSNSYTISGGYVQGESGAYQGTQPNNYELSDLYSVNPTFSSTLSAANADVGFAAITISGGTVLSGLSVTTVNDGTLTVTPRPLVLTASADNKVYDGTNLATGSITSDALDGDDISIGVGTPTFSQSNIGTGLTVTFNGPTKSGTDAGNYTLPGDLTTATADITARPLTLSGLVVQDKTYDQSTGAAVANFGTLTNIVSGETVTLDTTGVSAVFDSADAGSRTATISGLSLSGAGAANYSLADPTGSATINPLMLTLGLTGQNKVYDQTTDATVTVTDNALTGDDVTVTYDADFDDRHVGDGKTVTLTNIGLTGSQAGNYAVPASQTTTANITPRSLTITISASDKVYDGSDAASITFGDNRISGDRLSFAGSASFDNANAATGKTVTAPSIAVSGTDAGNYSYNTSATDTADITPLALTATATVAGKTYDGSDDASVTLSLAGLVTGEDLGQTVTASFDSVNAGTRTATIDSFQLDDGTNGLGSNYSLAAGDITFTANTATIATRAITLTAADVSQVYGDSDATLSVTASAHGLASTDTLAEVTGTLTRESGSNVGSYDVALGTGADAGSKASNYAITFDTDNNAYEITPLALTLSGFAVADKTYDSTTAAMVSSYGTFTNLVGADVVSIDSSSVSAVFDNANVGTRTATVTGIALSGADAGNYSIADQTDSASITAFTLDLGLTASDKVYDGSDAATVTASPNVFSGDDVSVTFNAAFSNENVADNKVISLSSLSLTGTDAGNYALPSTPSVTANIMPKPLTLTYTANNRVYDGTTDATVSFTDDRISGDTLTVSETAAFADKNVGNGKTVSITGVTLGGTDAANYSLVTPINPTANITARDLTLTYTGNNRVYDGTTDATVSVTDDRITDDVLSITQTAAFADKDVGSGKTISLSGVSVTGTDAGNYNVLTPTNPTADITARSLTVTIDAANKVYDGNSDASVTYADNRVDSDVLSVTGTASFANKNVGTGKAVTASSISLSGTDAGNYTVNTSATDTADITTRTLTVNLIGDNRVYDGTTDATISSTDDRVSGDNLALDYTAAFSDPNVGNGKSISVTGISLLGSDAGNYSVASTGSTTANITARSLTVTADASDKVYDGNTTASVTYSDNRISGDDVSVSGTATFDNENVGSGKTVSISGISLSGDDAGNYIVNSTATDTAAITARALTLNGFSIADKTYDQSTSATVASYGTLANLVSGDTVSIDSSSVSSTFDSANVGTRTATVTGIALSGADAANYSIADQTGNAEITAFTLDLGLTATDKVYDGTASASVTASPNELSGDDVSVSFNAAFSNKNVANNKVINLTNLTLSGTDAANYTLPASPSVTADITARDLTLTYTAVDRVYDGSTNANVSVTDNRISGDTLSITQAAAFADKNVGNNKTVTLSGVSLSGTDAANYNLLTPTNPTADITARDLTLTYTGTNRVYDGTTDATVTVSDDRVSGDVLSIAQTAAFADKNVGSGKTISLSGVNLTGTDAANYNLITPTNPTADITARSLTVTADASDKVYDGNNTASVTYSDNRVSGDVLTVSGSAAFDNKHVGSGKSVTVSGISLAGADAANYSVNTSASDTANISARTLTLTLTGDNRVYDGTTDATVSVADDRVAGDNIALDYSAAFSDKNVGSGKTISVTGISLLGSDASNYSVASSDSTTGNITARALNFTVAAQNKVYDQSSTAQVNITDDRVSGDDLSASFTASFSDDQAGANKAVAINGFALNGADAANYSYTAPTSTTASITQRVMDLTVAAQDKVYDGTQSATVTVTDDRLSGDTLSYTYNAQFADKNVGIGKAVQLAGLALTGTDASNYELPTNAAGSASITARTLNITANPINRVYDGTRAVNVSYSDDRIAGDDFSISATALMTDKLAGANKSVALSNLALSGADAGNYTATIASLGLVDIDRRALTVSADAKDKNYDATRIALVDLKDDRISGDQLSLAYSALFENAQAGTNKLVDLLSLNLSGSDAPNYRLGSLPVGLRADIVNQQTDNLVFAPVKEPESSLSPDMDPEKDILQIDQGLTAVALPEPPKVDAGPITVEVIAEPDVEFNGMVVVTMDLEEVESARFALPSSIRQLKPVGVQASAELRGGAPLPEWLTFDPNTMEFEALGNAQLDAPMQVDLVFGQYRLSVLVLPEELEAL